MKTNRRTILAFAGMSAMGASGLRSLSVLAQSDPASPYTFGDGTVFTWTDPWVYGGQINTDSPYADCVYLWNGQATLAAAYFSAPTEINDWVTWHLSTFGRDNTTAPEVAGGSEEVVGADGVTESQAEFRVHIFEDDDKVQWGIYYQTVDQLNATLLFAPITEFASFMESAQASATIDDIPVFADADGVKVQADMESGIGRLPSSDAADTSAGTGGEYTDATGNLHVTWPDGWTVVSSDDIGTELANPEQTVILNLQAVAFEGRTWDQAAHDDIDWLAGDQGASATLTGPMVTETGYLFATEGDQGLRLVQGMATDNDLDYYVRVFAGNMEANGADALAILEQIQADITVNGQVPLEGADTLIDMSES